MRNIFIEGLQGMGKSTLVNRIAKKYPEYHICREGDYSPVDLAWCTWMTKEEYDAVLEKYAPMREEIIQHTVREKEHYITSYLQVLTDIPGFHKDLEQYEIYNGRKTFEELKEIVFQRYMNFRNSKSDGYVFECAFFQNIMEDLILFHKLSDDEIVAFYQELYQLMDHGKFLLVYLSDQDVNKVIRRVKQERCDSRGNEIWYQMMLEYLKHSPCGREEGYHTLDDLINHLKHRQSLELRVIEEVIGENAMILQAWNWNPD